MSESPQSLAGPEDRLRDLQDIQRAVLNILEDFGAEKSHLEETQRATLNILDDFDVEKGWLEDIQRASANILEDFDAEKGQLLSTQRATLNILDDFGMEQARLEQMQSAVLNILEDFELEKGKVESANRELSATSKELEAFTYSVSHDLRAPLRHIDGFSQLLSEDFGPQLPEDARRYLERIRSGTRQMGQLVDDFLNLARVGRQELRLQVTGLKSLVEEVRRELLAEAEGRQVQWEVGSLPFVECDPALLKQVFANLLSNALKYTRPRNPAVIEVGVQQENGLPVIHVRDNGVGFSMKYAHKLFGVFQRLHRPEDFEGTGVGLATVQRIIHKHRGRVWAEAELDKGATFYFSLGNPSENETPPRA